MTGELESRYTISDSGFSNTLSNSTPMQTINMGNLNDHNFDLSSPLNVKCNFAVDFLLVSNSKYMYISHGLAVMGT